MNLKTRLFGDISVGDDKVVYFENGIIGFPTLKKFAIVHDAQKPNASIVWLQSLDEGEFAMPVLIPNSILPDYAPSVDPNALEALGEYEEGGLMLFTTITVPSDIEKMTINLKAPIIINNSNRYAVQIIADNIEYPVRYQFMICLLQRKAGGK